MRKLATAAIVTCVALFGIAATASAHNAIYRSNTVIEYFPPDAEFSTHDVIGVIWSRKQACEAKRKIVLLRNGNPVARGTSHRYAKIDGGEDAWYGFTTDENAFPPGSYYAKAPSKLLKRTKRHRHRCGMALSNEIRISEASTTASRTPLPGWPIAELQLSDRAR
jgi:hypothetical protein